jgi:NADPH:quinone reductase-like Zn-dependent oxidoreductase
MTDIPRTTLALALREGGYAKGAVPAVPEALDPFLELREVALPELAEGQVLIEVIMSPVNPSDLFFIQGGYGQPRMAGTAAGFEGAGRVIAGAGTAAKALIGQRVAFLGTRTGAWARHAISEAALCLPLREDLRDADGAALIVNPLTAVALVELARANRGPAFVVNAAASQLGRLIVGLARDEGLAPIALLRSDRDSAEMTALGAQEVLITTAPDYETRLREVIGRLKPRVLLDAVGDQGAADLFFAMPAGARWISYGKMSPEAPRLSQMGQFIFMDKKIEGFWLSRWLPAAPPERRAALVAGVQARFADGRWQTRVAAELGLEQAMSGILPALARGAGKVMVRPGG